MRRSRSCGGAAAVEEEVQLGVTGVEPPVVEGAAVVLSLFGGASTSAKV